MNLPMILLHFVNYMAANYKSFALFVLKKDFDYF